MKKKNGFTLIELLAVIIILGILMIIAIPSVTSYINNSRKSAYVDSAKEIIAGARNFVNEGKVPMYDTSATYYIKSSCISTENGQKSPYGEFVDEETYVIVTYDGKGYDYYWVSRDTTGQGVPTPTALKDLDEDDIKSDIALGTIIPTKISDDKSNVQLINSTCNGFVDAVEGGSTTPTNVVVYPEGKTKATVVVGDLVKIGDEEFYVVKHDGDDLILLSRYNLKVGNKFNRSTWNVFDEYTNNDEGYGKQNSESKGYMSADSYWYGTVSFSGTNYWEGKIAYIYQNNVNPYYQGNVCDISVNSPTTNCTYVYDSNSSIKSYVDAYKDYLVNEIGVPIKDTRLLRVEEAYELGCSTLNNTTLPDCNNAHSFVRETSYWLGTCYSSLSIWVIQSNGKIMSTNYESNNYYGVRPVIVI